jgi:anti-sigma regulatory factor (Ser/Thr protein kinase)
VDLALEELFTNMVKYGSSVTDIVVEIARVPGGAEVTLVEEGAERFDPMGGPAIDVHAPIEQRKPGGLGLHLVRQLVDFVDYRYSADRRQGRTTFRKTVPEPDRKG